jgi:hypothetical protein
MSTPIGPASKPRPIVLPFMCQLATRASELALYERLMRLKYAQDRGQELRRKSVDFENAHVRSTGTSFILAAAAAAAAPSDGRYGSSGDDSSDDDMRERARALDSPDMYF